MNNIVQMANIQAFEYGSTEFGSFILWEVSFDYLIEKLPAFYDFCDYIIANLILEALINFDNIGVV